MEGIDNQREYWDRVAWEKTFTLPLDITQLQELVSVEERILDYGCGYGRLSSELWEYGFRNIVGVDASPEMIRRAQWEHPYLDFQVVNGDLTPFADESFDAALAIVVLTCIPTDEGQRSVIRNIHRVLRPGGTLCICDFFLQADERNQARYREFEEEYGTYGVFRLPEGAVLRHHSNDWIASLTSDFQQLHMSEIETITMNGNPARAFRYFGRKMG